MADAEFFGLFGLDPPETEPLRRTLFKELVSLFDTLHDFGTFGSVHDYVTKNKGNGEFLTNRRTIFNHLRNGYEMLRDYPEISTTNSQLHCFDIGFHLKASLNKAKLEDAFFNYAANNLIDESNKIGPLNFKDPDLGNLKEYMSPKSPIIFSVDTQKKLFAIPGLRGWQTYDREKRCDPASHSSEDKGDILILRELSNSPKRIYYPDGVFRAIISGDSVENATIQIDLEGSPGNEIKMDGLAAKHKNNVSNINTQLKTLIATGEGMPLNKDVKPSMVFYNTLDYTSASDKYILNVRRKLAQKRLGDQIQVLACKEGITYMDSARQRWKVTNPIFVSIDRMAIAFAIAHGVSCIYSNGSNLQMFYGLNDTIMEPIGRGGSEEVETTKRGGRYRVDWEIYGEQLRSSPAHIMRLFMYNNVQRVEGNIVRGKFSESVSNSNILSLDTEGETYIIRSYHINPEESSQIIIDDDADNPIVFIQDGGNKWKIVSDANEKYVLKKDGIQVVVLSLEELHGMMQIDAVMETMEGGGGNKEFLKTLAQYDLLILCDEEQTKIWYDEFYTRDDGFTFHSPTFYELNAFFQFLFEEDIDYMLIFPFLKNSSNTFSKEVMYALERILDYMEISVSYDTKIDKANEAILVSVLERAAEKSKEYSHSISTLKGSNLLHYLFENKLTPLYFYNIFSERYQFKPNEDVLRRVSSKAVSRKRKYAIDLPLDRRVLIKAIGGKKKYKGSPRRKTLRKTRRDR
jgi:hypothetical protein